MKNADLLQEGLHLALTPAGRLVLREGGGPETAGPGPWLRRAAAAFKASPEAGLLALAATRPEVPPPPSFSFWRDFACDYLAALCRLPESSGGLPGPIPPPPAPKLWTWALSAPPMEGAEYLEPRVLEEIWKGLDAWVRAEIRASKAGTAGWLKKHAPLWHQVGRVCFHLAENKRDPEYPFAFLATYAPRISKVGRVQYQPLGRALKEYAGQKNKAALVRLLTPVHRASEKVPFVKELVDSGEIFHPLAWTPAEAYRLLKSVPLLEECGLLVRLPDWWSKRPRPRVAVTIGDRKKSRFNADAMLDFKVRLALGDQVLTPEEWKKIMDSGGGLVFVKGRWVEADPEKLAQALEHWKRVEARAGREGISFLEGMRLLAGAPADLAGEEKLEEVRDWAFVNAGKWLSQVLEGLRDPEGLDGRMRTGNFRGTLRPYQETGLKWLWFLSNLGLGGCLADDMGLGKTIQVLALLLALKERDKGKKRAGKPSLLVLPASLLANWKAEMRRFAPDLRGLFLHRSEMEKKALDAVEKNPGRALAGKDVVLTTYGMLVRQAWLAEVKWRLVVLDEAQAIKNPSTRQARAAKKLQAEARIALTGTPVENRLGDLWSLFDFLCPGLLGSAQKFKRFVKGLEARERERYAPLRNLVRPYILRRLKTDKRIISDLPEKTEMKTFCGLTKKQASLYAASVRDLAQGLEGADGIKRRGLVLSFLLRFKQICNHPSQFLGDGEYDPAGSGKFERLRGICEEIASRQEKVLVFTQFREMTDPIAAFLAEVFGREGLVLHGGTAVGKRRSLIDLFQRDDGPPFFVLSLKAGGTGLNLTAASHVVHFDRWWNPAVENQATDRAFRIGQRKNVVVHKFVCRGTVEEKIDALIEEKTGLAEEILKGGGEAVLTEMSDEELLRTVALDLDRAVL